MPGPSVLLRDQARVIWDAAVAAVRPEDLVRAAFEDPALGLRAAVARAQQIVVVGAGKAGAAMSAGVEQALADDLGRVEGLVNVPAGSSRPLRAIRLHAARPVGRNEPTAEGVAGTQQILDLLAGAGHDAIGFCLLSGGGSALLPAPPEGVTLEDKQQVTRLLTACGATITEMNAVRKHLSRSKGGQLARAFTGRDFFGLIISDVIGDPLDVIASGPTAPDPTTFADALAVLQKYHLIPDGRGQGKGPCAPARVLQHLEQGNQGKIPETPKALPASVHNVVIGNNARALAAARRQAEQQGYPVLDLGAFIEGETQAVARVFAAIVRSIRANGQPVPPLVCLLSGGETTVTLAEGHGLGGRNQEFVLAVLDQLGRDGLHEVAVLSGGTDGEDGPTDAAGAVADQETLSRAAAAGLDTASFLARHDAYRFFEATGSLLRTGLTETNVMDVRVILVR